MEGVKQCLAAINLKYVLLISQLNHYLWRICRYVCVHRERVAVGIAAPATAKEEIPCQEMNHCIRTHVQSPRDGDLPGNQTKC